MKKEATDARRARLKAANRLIKHIHPEEIEPKTPKAKVRHMVPPKELAVKVITA